MDNPTNTKSSIYVFILIVSFSLFAIIYTFSNENWTFSNNVHIRSILVIIVIEIIAIIKLFFLVKEYRKTKGKNPDTYIILPISFSFSVSVMGFYMLFLYPINFISFETILGIVTGIFSILYILIYYLLRKASKEEITLLKLMILNSFILLVLTIVVSVYLFVYYPFIPYTVHTDLASFFTLVSIGISIYLLDFMLELKSLSIIKVKKLDGNNTFIIR